MWVVVHNRQVCPNASEKKVFFWCAAEGYITLCFGAAGASFSTLKHKYSTRTNTPFLLLTEKKLYKHWQLAATSQFEKHNNTH